LKDFALAALGQGVLSHWGKQAGGRLWRKRGKAELRVNLTFASLRDWCRLIALERSYFGFAMYKPFVTSSES
jgi:hypothetical protein